jgi:hypothetical protein
MIYIDPNSKSNKNALKIHSLKLLPLIKRRVVNSNDQKFIAYFTDTKITDLLTLKPDQLIVLNRNFYSSLQGYSFSEYQKFVQNKSTKYVDLSSPALKSNRTRYEKLNSKLKKLFNYENSFSKIDYSNKNYRAYNLAENLNINTCVYCNRLYTKTVIKPKKVTRPEFDHWFPKSIYPLLSLSFFNLIPSCHVCNSGVKGSREFDLNDYIHPYVDNLIGIRFSYIYKTGLKSYEFNVKYSNEKEMNTVQAFKIKEIYKTHEDEIKDLVTIKKVYSDTYLSKLKKLLGSSVVSEAEIYRLAFGVYINESDFVKRPLSKMKRDLLNELNIIK